MFKISKFLKNPKKVQNLKIIEKSKKSSKFKFLKNPKKVQNSKIFQKSKKSSKFKLLKIF